MIPKVRIAVVGTGWWSTYAHIRGAAANGAPGELGWRAVELLDAAYRSAERGGQPVAVDELYA